LQAQKQFALEFVRQNQAHSIHDAGCLLAVAQLIQLFSPL
jgi:hypothetical protein